MTSTRLRELLLLRDRIDDEIAAEQRRHARIRHLTATIGRDLTDHPLLIVAAVADHYAVPTTGLLGTAHSPAVARARAAAAWIARDAGLTWAEVGELLCSHPNSLSRRVHRVRTDPALLAEAEAIRDRLVHPHQTEAAS